MIKMSLDYLNFGEWNLFGVCLPAVGRGFGYWNLIDYRMNDIGHGKDSKVAKLVSLYEI
jgi:hypothetical protein